MRHHAGFSLTELVVCTLSAAVFTVVFLLPPHSRELADSSICGTRLNGLYKAINTYSVTNREQFPIYKTEDPSGKVVGFKEGDRVTGTGAVLENNITAPWWIIVRDGSVSPKSYICPASGDEEDLVALPWTDSSLGTLQKTFDFLHRKHLSYSTMNMYHPLVGKQWGPNSNADWVFAADNNANDYDGTPERHTLSKGASREDIDKAENSPNHRYEGQNIMFGDGHVSFSNDPFQGPDGDNINAFAGERGSEPPSVYKTAGHEQDVVLVPLSGNGGGDDSLSGLKLDVTSRTDASWGRFTFFGIVAIIAVVFMILWELLKPRKKAESQAPDTA